MRVNCKECGKHFVNEEYLRLHMGYAHPASTGAPKRKGWATPYGFCDFTKPVTYEEACEEMKKVFSEFWSKTND